MTKLKARTVLAFISVVGYILITISFGVVLFLGDQVTLPDGDIGKQIIGMLGMIVGTWNAAILMVYTFHYGTTQGSSEHSETIKEVLKRKIELPVEEPPPSE